MNHAIKFYETGGADVLRWERVETPAPGPGEVLIRQSHVGLNYIDVYFRSGLYPVPALPAVPGMEGAGIVEKVGANVTDLKPGDRVAYASRPLGAYAERRLMPAARLIKLPDDITEDIAAAAMVKGMSAEYLLRRTFPVQAGQTILFHAAAGGVGLIACQWAKALGATVIGTAGGAEKVALAKAHGRDYVIDYKSENFVERVRDITGGKGVPVVYDSVGQSTFMGSLDCLSPRGMMVSFGNASGPVAPFAPGILSSKGSLFLTRPSLNDYTNNTAEYQSSAAALFDIIRSGKVKIPLHRRYKLADAAQAHRELEARKTTGCSIFDV